MLKFELCDRGFVPPFEQVSSIAVVLFRRAGGLVVVRLARGIDLPGGHVEPFESQFKEVIDRELSEEAGVTCSEFRHVVAIKVSDEGGAQSKKQFMEVVTAFVDEPLEPFVPQYESQERLIMTAEDFLSQFDHWVPDMMRQIVSIAQAMMFS